MLIDVNVLVAVFRPDHFHHATAQAWLNKQLADPAGDGLHVTTGLLASALRLTTNPRVFAKPSNPDRAIAFFDWLLEHPRVTLVNIGHEWPTFRKLIIEQDLRGDAVPDGQLAAIAKHHRLRFVTFDKGFRKLLPAMSLELLKAPSH